MMRFYTPIRVAGYVFGLAGLILILAGRRGGPHGPAIAATGAGLLVLMAVCLFITYFLYVWVRIIRRNKGE